MEKYIDKVIETFEENGTVDLKRLTAAIIFDSIYELKKLEGESYVKSAIELLDVISKHDLL